MLDHTRALSYCRRAAARSAFLWYLAATVAGALVVAWPEPARSQSAIGLLAEEPGAAATHAASEDAALSYDVSLEIDFAELVFNSRAAAPAKLGFLWDAAAAPACSDGRNNDDYAVLGRGVQDALIDFPADPECVSSSDASEDAAGLQQARRVSLRGKLARDGRLRFPASGIDIPSVWAFGGARSAGDDGAYRYDFIPVGTATGSLNPFTRAIGLTLGFRIRVNDAGLGGFGALGETCSVGSVAEPIRMQLSTTGAHSPAGLPLLVGSALDAQTGSFEMVGYNVRDTAGASGCGAFGARDAAIAAAFGVPAGPGNVRMTLRGRIQPIIAPFEGIDAEALRSRPEPAPADPPAERGDVADRAGRVFDFGADEPTADDARAVPDAPAVSTSAGTPSVGAMTPPELVTAPTEEAVSASSSGVSPIGSSAKPSVEPALGSAAAIMEKAEPLRDASAEQPPGAGDATPVLESQKAPPPDAKVAQESAVLQPPAAAPPMDAALPLQEVVDETMRPTPPIKAGPSAATAPDAMEGAAGIVLRELDDAHRKTMAPQLTEPAEIITTAPRVPQAPTAVDSEPPAADAAPVVLQSEPPAADVAPADEDGEPVPGDAEPAPMPSELAHTGAEPAAVDDSAPVPLRAPSVVPKLPVSPSPAGPPAAQDSPAPMPPAP